MGSLSSLFDLARGALGADQAALGATSSNVANQNTVGYTREVATWNAGDTVTLNASTGSELNLSGPKLTIASQRDRVLEQRVQQQTQTQASTSARSDALSQVQNVFNVSSSAATSGSTQLGADINSFFNSLTTLATNASSTVTQQTVLSSANALAGDFNRSANQLQQISLTLNSDVATSVTAVNGLTSTIAQLNQQIASVSPGGDAGALEDQRQSAITQLSQYVGLDQIRNEQNGITLTTTGGATLVSGSKAFALATTVVGGTVQVKDSTGADVTAGITGGSIGGQLTALTEDIPQTKTALDNAAYRIGAAVNAQNGLGFTASGASGTAIFSIPSSAAGAAAAISVIPTDPAAIASAGAGEGNTGNSNALALAAIALATDPSGATIAGSYAALLSNVGNTASTLIEQNTAQQASLTQLKTQRDSLSAVSLDQEAANLTQYQNSYNAAAKLFSIVNTLLSSAINLGTATTV